MVRFIVRRIVGMVIVMFAVSYHVAWSGIVSGYCGKSLRLIALIFLTHL